FNTGTGFVRNFAGANNSYDFDAIHPGGTNTAQGDFVAPPTTQQVVRASIEFQQGGTYGFGMVQTGPYLWGDFVTETYPTEELILDPGTGSAFEERTYVVRSSATAFHSITINPPASGEFTSERYARLWLEDTIVNDSFARDVQMSIWYSTDNGSSFDQITGFLGGTAITAGTEVDDTSGVPAVIRVPDGTTNMRLDFEGWNSGEANGLEIFPGNPSGQLDLYGFAIDFYGGGEPSGGS
ncbi:MAG: hypothetical protein ACOCYG_07285, partial [Spirochaetota bacterium]